MLKSNKNPDSAPSTLMRRATNAEQESLIGELAASGIAIRTKTGHFFTDNRELLSRPNISHLTIHINNKYELSMHNLMGFGQPTVIIFDSSRIRLAASALESRFNSMGHDQEGPERITFVRWLHANGMYTQLEYGVLERIFGAKESYTREEYMAASTKINYVRVGKRKYQEGKRASDQPNQNDIKP